MNSHNIYWYLPPILLATALVCAASRHETWNRILPKAAYWAWYILQFLGLTFLVIWGMGELQGNWWKVYGPLFLAWWLFGKWRARRAASA